MSSHSAYPIIQLAITPKSLGKIDILAPVSYVGEGFLNLADFGRLRKYQGREIYVPQRSRNVRHRTDVVR